MKCIATPRKKKMLPIEETQGKARHTRFRIMTHHEALSSNLTQYQAYTMDSFASKYNLFHSVKMQHQTPIGVRKHRVFIKKPRKKIIPKIYTADSRGHLKL